jgi:hypothetical protein
VAHQITLMAFRVAVAFAKLASACLHMGPNLQLGSGCQNVAMRLSHKDYVIPDPASFGEVEDIHLNRHDLCSPSWALTMTAQPAAPLRKASNIDG